jgi:hypothetical protein
MFSLDKTVFFFNKMLLKFNKNIGTLTAITLFVTLLTLIFIILVVSTNPRSSVWFGFGSYYDFILGTVFFFYFSVYLYALQSLKDPQILISGSYGKKMYQISKNKKMSFRSFSTAPLENQGNPWVFVQSFSVFINFIFLYVVYYLNTTIKTLQSENILLMETLNKVNVELMELKQLLNSPENTTQFLDFASGVENSFILLGLLMACGFLFVSVLIATRSGVDSAGITSSVVDGAKMTTTTIMQHLDGLHEKTLKALELVDEDLLARVAEGLTGLDDHLISNHLELIKLLMAKDVPLPTTRIFTGSAETLSLYPPQ